jgi:AcrR family transcriptional regulator
MGLEAMSTQSPHPDRSPSAPAATRAVPASPRSAAKRSNVLAAAWELFGARGFGRTSMRELAAEAGVSTATIYAHFPNKQDLLAALIEERWERVLGDMLGRAAEVDDPLERLLVAITALNHGIAADPLLRQLLVTPRRVGDAHLAARVAPIEDMMDARCAEAIREAVAAGRLACADPEALAVLIRLSMQGWLLTESKRRQPMSETRVTAALVALLRGTPVG